MFDKLRGKLPAKDKRASSAAVIQDDSSTTRDSQAYTERTSNDLQSTGDFTSNEHLPDKPSPPPELNPSKPWLGVKRDYPKVPSPTPTYKPSTSKPPPPPPFQTRFASLSMHMNDRLRFLRFPPEIISHLRRTILSTWPQGIQYERPYGPSHEIQLRGYPWQGTGSEAFEARRLMKGLLATLHSIGWVLNLNTDISKTQYDKDSLVFRFQTPEPALCEWCSIAFSGRNRIRFIDAPGELFASLPERLTGLERGWVRSQEWYARDVWDVKLMGSPWLATGTETMLVREMVLVLVEMLEEEGWSVYASIDQKSTGNGRSETDTWYVCRPLGWERGMPVYQR